MATYSQMIMLLETISLLDKKNGIGIELLNKYTNQIYLYNHLMKMKYLVEMRRFNMWQSL